jgi:hypothetical protein
MATFDATQKVENMHHKNYVCDYCDYKTFKITDYNKHLLTRKHSLATNANQMSPQKLWSCICNKSFKHSSSLSRHKKKCTQTEICTGIQNVNPGENYDDEEGEFQLITKDMVVKLIKENGEIKHLLCKQSEKIDEQHKQITEMLPKINAVTNIQNAHIKQSAHIKQNFNINIFLNEKCKDALNMDEFINKIEITLDQLDITKNKGLLEGLSNVFLENMKKLSVYERPIHCTDVKRETLYIKNDDNWEKDKDNTKIKRAIKNTSNKQYKTLQQWKKVNPDFYEIDEKQDYFAKTISAIGKPLNVVDEKIIKKICTNTYIKSDSE